MDKFDLSVVVATCDRPAMLTKCVESILRQKTDMRYEVIILDQSDIQRQHSLFVENRQLRVIKCDFKNKSRALNRGVNLARSAYVVVVDDDCVVHERWIESAYSALLEYPHAVVTGRVIAGDVESGAVRSRLHDDLTRRVIYRRGGITPIFKLSGCNFCFTKQTYNIVGPFDTSFGPGSLFKSSDDNEWSYRALRKRLKIVYDPQMLVFHRSWRGRDADRKLMEDYGYSAGAFFGLIAKASKFDFFYHSFRLWGWLFSTILFSFNAQEIFNHFLYGLNFIYGFRAYRSYAQ